MANKETIALLKEANRLRVEALSRIKDISKGDSVVAAGLKKTDTIYKDIVSKLKNINAEISEERSMLQEKLGNLVSQEKALKGLTGLQASLVSTEREKLTMLAAMPGLNDEVRSSIQSISDLNQELLETSAEDVITKAHINNQLDTEFKTLKGKRGIHIQLRKLMESERSIAENVSNLTEKQQSALNSQTDAYESIKEKVAGLLETASLLTSNWKAGVGAVLVGIGMWQNKVTDVNKELGFTVLDMNSAVKSAGLLSFIFDDVAGTVKALTNEFGTLESATFNTQFRVGAMASLMGISNTEAAQLVGHFARLNGGSADIAADMIQTTKEYAKQNNVIPSQVLSDLAGSAEEFALFAKAGGENMIKAAAGARMLGTDLGTVSAIAEGLLDFESSMTKELELSAMLGKNINLSKARQLAYDDDILGATKEVLNQVGGIAAFNRMDYFQKKQTADLLGISVAEMKKMAENQKNIGSMGSVVNKEFSDLSATLNLITNKYLGTGIEVLGGWVASSAQVGANFSRLGLPIGKLLSPLGTIVSSTGQILKNLWQMTGGAMLKGLSKLGGTLANATGLGGSKIGKSLSSVKDRLLKGTGKSKMLDVGSAGEKSFGKGSITDKLGKINMTAVLKGAAALVIVAGAVWVFGKAVQEFMKVSWESVGMAVVSMLALVGAVAILGALMSSGIGAVAILAGAAAMVVVAGSMYILGKAIQEMAIGFTEMDKIGSTITTLVGQLGGIASLSIAFMGLAVGLGVLSTALVATSVASLLGGGIITKIERLSGISTGLTQTSTALGAMGTALGTIATQLDRLDVSKLDALRDFSITASIGSAVTGIAESIGGVIDTVGTILGTEKVSDYETKMLSSMDKLISAVNRNRDVYLDKEKVTNIVKKTSDKQTNNSDFGLAGA